MCLVYRLKKEDVSNSSNIGNICVSAREDKTQTDNWLTLSRAPHRKSTGTSACRACWTPPWTARCTTRCATGWRWRRPRPRWGKEGCKASPWRTATKRTTTSKAVGRHHPLIPPPPSLWSDHFYCFRPHHCKDHFVVFTKQGVYFTIFLSALFRSASKHFSWTMHMVILVSALIYPVTQTSL